MQTFIRIIIIPQPCRGHCRRLPARDATGNGPVHVSDLMGGAKNPLIGNVIKVQFLNIRDCRCGAIANTLTIVMTHAVDLLAGFPLIE